MKIGVSIGGRGCSCGAVRAGGRLATVRWCRLHWSSATAAQNQTPAALPLCQVSPILKALPLLIKMLLVILLSRSRIIHLVAIDILTFVIYNNSFIINIEIGIYKVMKNEKSTDIYFYSHIK